MFVYVFTVAHPLYHVEDIYGYFNPLWPYRYQCTRSEYSLQSCDHYYAVGCDSLSDDLAGVHCTSILVMLKHFLISSRSQVYFLSSSGSPCIDGQLQLGGGQTSNEGRLEYCHQGMWSPFCNLDDEEATVACKQLGYTAYPCEYTTINKNITMMMMNY